MHTRKILASAALAAILAVVGAPVQAQDAYGASLGRLINGQQAGRAYATDDTDVALLIRYVGTGTGGNVAVAAGGDITFTTGPVGSSVADTSLECPVSGALGGVIDVSDTACDTLGEVVDIINASSDWKAVILDGLRSDSSNDTLNALSEATATSRDGLGLVWDTSVAFKTTIAIVPPAARSMRFYLAGGGTGNKLVPDPFRGSEAVVFRTATTDTFGSGTSTLQFISVRSTVSGSNQAGSETATTVYSTAGGATTVEKELDFPYGLWGGKDEKLLFRVNNSAAMSSVSAAAAGRFLQAR